MRSRGLTVAVVASVALVFALAYVDDRREEARALDDFMGEEAALALALAATVTATMGGVLRDLGIAARAPATIEPLVWPGGPYEELDMLDGGGKVVRALHGDAARQAALAALFARATPNGAAVVSAPLARAGETHERLRYFLRRTGDGAVALLVDGERFFARAPMRHVVRDAEGRWAVLGGGVADSAWQTARPTAEIDALLAAMARGEEGALFLPRPSADALGLGERGAVAGFAPVRLPELGWSVAVVTSAKRVRDRAQLAAWRLAAATGLTALIVGLFGVAITRQQRRAQTLAEALKLAGATAALRERSEKLVESVPLGVLAGARPAIGEPRVDRRDPRGGVDGDRKSVV